MLRVLLKSKIHRATITGADLNYVGSLTVDEELLTAADLLPGERVTIANLRDGNRLETYLLAGERGSGVVVANGAAAHLLHPGDLVIILAYAMVEDAQARTFAPHVVLVDHNNQISQAFFGLTPPSAAGNDLEQE